MIKAIIFDLGGVLIDEPTQTMRRYCAHAFGVDEPTFSKAYEKYEYLHNTAKVPENDFWKYVAKELNVPNRGSEELWSKAFALAYKPRQAVFDLAAKQKSDGYKIALLTNTEIAGMKYFLAQNYPMFDVTVFSCAEHKAKPDPAIYLTTLERLDVTPAEAMFVDDREVNLQAARQLGIHAIMFSGAEQLELEMAELAAANR